MTNNRDGGKGDTPRPLSVDQNTFEENWNRIFNEKPENTVEFDVEADNDHVEILATIPFGK